jgi:hypothetical protein
MWQPFRALPAYLGGKRRLALEIPYRDLGSIASAQRNAENRELLVIAAGEGVQP